MKDRYLFRGKRTDNGDWVIGSYIPKWFDGARISSVIIVDDSDNEELGILDDRLIKYYVDPKTIGQCTSLKDKNGKLIFEGDEVVWLGDIWTIVWENGYFCYGDRVNPIRHYNEIEIMGTIHDEN